MKKKILGIFVCTLLIATALPAVGAINVSKTKIVGEIVDSDDKSATWVDANYMPVLTDEEYEEKRLEAYQEIRSTRGWYWKPPYKNYAPHTPGGMPDFNQTQNEWKAIGPGLNGVIDSIPAGDDFYNASVNRIVPGQNCMLETTPAGDDVAYWTFCGPVAVANCFWWFDSKYADPTGTPGDGNDIFRLVEDYGAGDDHSAANAPLLICKLANAMKTCEKGTTYISDMQAAIDDWFIDTGLDTFFEENTYNKPTFEFIEAEIERSQDVILLIGYYRPAKVVDQKQKNWTAFRSIFKWKPGAVQGFTPTISSLDAVQLFFTGYDLGPTTVEVSIYDTFPDNSSVTPIENSTMVIDPPRTQMWYQFHFDPTIYLTPGNQYFIAVRSLDLEDNVCWYRTMYDSYPGGISYYTYGENYTIHNFTNEDYTFKTEYYGDDCVRTGGHYLTCAGVNSEELMIAVSDPYWNVQNPNGNDHNDAQYVSHDTYDVEIGCPCPNLDYKWWLPDYPAVYAVVEQAVVICPIAEEECCLEINSLTGGLLNFPVPSLRVKAVIKNNGTAECNNVTWSFSFSGGVVLWGPKSCTITSIPPGGTSIVKSRVVLGL
ncbi:MAG: hypothetical protein JSW60_08780, partial [Thermoplasmatales archaeon]